MTSAVERAVEALADALTEAVLDALITKGFDPSDKLREELYFLLRSHIRLG